MSNTRGNVVVERGLESLLDKQRDNGKHFNHAGYRGPIFENIDLIILFGDPTMTVRRSTDPQQNQPHLWQQRATITQSHPSPHDFLSFFLSIFFSEIKKNNEVGR